MSRIYYSHCLAAVVSCIAVVAMATSEACAQCSATVGGPIKVTRVPMAGGTAEFIGCFAAATDFGINLSSLSWSASDDWIIHIYDSTASPDPTLDIGEVTINGEASGVDFLAIHVSGPNWAWTDSYSDPISGLGCLDFGGITMSDPDTLAITRVSIAIGGDLGSLGIHANQIVRIQANGTDQGGGVVTGGHIEGDIVAEGGSLYGSSTTSIGQVQAWNTISGDIEAKQQNLFTIRVVADESMTASPGGITGDIKAEHGQIHSIWSSGPIGTALRNSQIRAGNGILEVRCRSFSNFEAAAPAEKNIYADIVSNLDYTGSGEAFFDGPIRLIQTDGSLYGSVTAGGITANYGGDVAGINVRGVVDAPITIEGVMDRAQIVAATFTEPIVIGIQSEGCIVATDEEYGEIPSIEIGYNPDPREGYETRLRGMLALRCQPLSPGTAGDLNAFDADDWLLPPTETGACYEFGARDTVIRAHHIGEARIASMTTHYIASGQGRKEFMPRIEADFIDTLQVDDLREGIIWSGNLEFEDGELANDPTTDYAAIGEMQIGDIGPYSDVWFQDCAFAEFTGDVYGELRVPALHYDEVIHVAGSLAQYTECGCVHTESTCVYPTPGSVADMFCEDSPRAPGNGATCLQPCAASGAVRIRQADGLAGQIILNAANVIDPPGDSWVGKVVVGDDGIVTSEVLAPGESQPYEAPYYEKSYLDIGGGAIGVGPYHLHETACFPAHNDPDPEHAVAQGKFLENGPLYDYYPVSIRFYGPVEPESESTITDVLKVEMLFEDTCQWADVTGVFTAVLFDGGRTLSLYADNSAMRPKPGLYRVYSEPGMLLSKYVSDDENPNDVVWPLTTFCAGEQEAEFEGYVFSVGKDCDLDGELDAYELNPPTNCVTCDCDFDDNNAVEVADLFNFLDAWFAQFPGGTPGSPSADYDNDTDVDVGDLFGFLDCWFAAFGYICGPS